MSVSVTKVRMAVADLTDDVVADILSDAAAGHAISDDKVVALCNALQAQRRGMRNIINLYANTQRDMFTLRREVSLKTAEYTVDTQKLIVLAEAARRHALKMRRDAATEMECAIQFEAALEAVATLARLKGATEEEIDEVIVGACDDVA